ncbi:TonB-dependent receptor plug domain-containing protein [Rhodospirillum centenum]|nr:TonB-dependent receptor [Rhodospirillum centenum]
MMLTRKSTVARLGLFLGACAALLPETARAQTSPEPTEEIIVTGTRRLDRTVSQSPVPIDVIPTADLQRSGLGELNKVLNSLVPSYNFPQPTVTDGTDHIRPATLRGLGPDHTLVLVNGKRRHQTSLLNLNGSVGRGSTGADLNTIPTAAIERIEILRDGAAAQYGSDAIAGVINIILKDGAEGGLVTGTVGQHYEGDGTLWHAQSNIGLPLGAAGGFVNLTAEYRDRGRTNRQGPDTRQQYNTLPNGQPDPREATIDRTDNFRYGDSAVEDINLFYNLGLPLADGVEAYSFGNYGRREGESGAFWRRPRDASNVRAIYPDGFLPLITSQIDDLSVAGGVRGETGRTNWDISTVYGRNYFPYRIKNTVNATFGTDSPTEFFAGDLLYQQVVSNADASREFDVGLPAPVSVAGGLEWRHENFQIGRGEFGSWADGGVKVLDNAAASPIGSQPSPGAQGFPGFRPADEVDESRSSQSAYIDLETNLTPELLLSLAGRVEHYSDFGWTESGKIAAKYDITDGFALRGAVSNGFRAPSLQQSFFTSTSTTYIGGVPYEIRTFRTDDPVAKALGAEDLKAEKSVNYSLGFTSRPFEGATLTVDAYRIEIDDRIVLSENLTGTAVQNFLAARGFLGVTGGRFFTNAIDTRTQGIDVVGTYRLDLAEAGQILFTAGANINDTKVTDVKPNPETLQAVGLDLVRFARVEEGRFTEAQPQDKVNLSAVWSWQGLDVTLKGTRYGEFTARNANPALDQTFGAEWVVDAEAAYEVVEGLTLAVGANNLFDQYPGTVIPGANTSGFAQYSNFSPFGFNGGFYYARVAYSW